MANEKDPQVTDKPKIEKVRDWLMRAGYPLEMRVARVFTMSPAFNRVVLADVYKSKGSESTLRDIDVAAQLAVFLHRPDAFEGQGVTMFFDLFTVCECKANPKGHRPWIVFTEEKAALDPSFRIQSHPANALGEWLLREIVTDERVAQLELFVAPRVGYSVRCARLGDNNPRDNDQDPAYEAVMAVMDAARAKADVTSDSFEMFRIVLPLIVVDADLYECWLDPKGQLELEPRDEMAVLWKTGPGIGAKSHVMIYIVTEAKLADWVKRVEFAHNMLSVDEERLKRGIQESWRSED